MKKCPSCGMEYPDSDSFCMECGSGLERVDERPSPPEVREAPRVPKALDADISRLDRRLRVVEDGVGGLNREVRDLKAVVPEDLELLRSAVEGTTGRISSLNSGIRAMSGRLDESEKRIRGIENAIEGLPSRQDMKKLEEDIAARFAGKAIKDNERFEGMEAEIKSGLNNLSAGFMKDLKAQLGSAIKRVEMLEGNLTRLIGGMEKMVEGRMEGFKTGFNQKVNKGMLELRSEVAEKTSIVSKLMENLKEQIKLNEERYSGFESRLKRELEDIDSFKEGLTVQQDARMKEFRTELLERLGEVKKLEEDLALHQQKRILLMEERVKQGLEGMRQGGQAPPPGPDMGEFVKLGREVENAIKGIRKLEEDLIIQQQGRLMAMESRIDEAARRLQPGEGTNINPKRKI